MLCKVGSVDTFYLLALNSTTDQFLFTAGKDHDTIQLRSNNFIHLRKTACLDISTMSVRGGEVYRW